MSIKIVLNACAKQIALQVQNALLPEESKGAETLPCVSGTLLQHMTQHFHTYHHTTDIFHPFSKSPTTSDWHRWHMHLLLWSSDFSNVWTQTETILATKRWPHSNRGIEGEWIFIIKESCLCDAIFCYDLQCSCPRLKLKDDFCYQVQMSVLTYIEW